MVQDWIFAWQVGGVGFALVFIILIALYLALALIGWLSTRYGHIEAKPMDKRTPAIIQEKKATQQG